jgi:hypothetical protein
MNIYSIENFENSIAFDPFSGFDGIFEGKSVGHFEYEKNCSKNNNDFDLCKVVIDNEILLRGNLLNIDKKSLLDKHTYIPTPAGSAWGACFGTIKYYDTKTDKLLGSYPFSAPIVYGPADFGISSSGKISITKNFENISVGFSTSDPAMKQCIGGIDGSKDLRTIDTNIYSSRSSGIIDKENGHIEYQWMVTLLHPNANIALTKNSLSSQNKIGNNINLIFQTSEDPVPNRPPIASIQIKPSNIVESNTRVILDGKDSKDPDPGDDIIKYEWRSVANNIVLNSTTSKAVEFIAPMVTQPTIFTFSLTVFDMFLKPNTTFAHITVNPKTNTPPIAVATCTTPNGVCINIQPDSQIKLSGFKSYDPDAPNDSVVGYQWKKTNPEDNIVKNTLSSPNSIETNFDMPYFVPYQFTSISTPPKLLPIEFSLVVTDTHGTKSQPDKLSINMECSAFDKTRGEYFRDLLRGAIILNNEFPFLNPQTADNMRYFLSGAGDIIPNRDAKGNFVGVTENDNPKPLPIEWLENTSYFQKAQKDLAKLILKDVNDLLKQMEVGESRILNPAIPYRVHIETSGNIPVDFVTAIGSAPAFADVELIITKSGFFKANTISGKIELKLEDIYDFNPNQIFKIHLLGVATSADIYNTIKCLGARNFDQTTIYNKIITDMNVRSFLNDFPDCDDPDDCKIQK